MIRNSLDDANWKDGKALAAAIKPICMAPNAEATLAELEVFTQGPWGKKLPTVAAKWRIATLRNITADLSRASRNWKEAMNQFAILYKDRFAKCIK